MQTKLQNPIPPKANKSNQQPATELTFIEHIYELRSRLFWCVATVIVASALGFQFKDQLIAAVMAPLHGEKLVYLTPGGGFSFIFTLSIYFGVLLAIPVIIYHIYRFMQPLLKRTSRRLVSSFMVLSTLLAVGGAAFGYFVTIPAALNFLSTFAGDAVTPNLTADSYLSFVVAYVLGLAMLFQLPLLLFLFDHIKPFPPGSLLSTQRFVIIGATIVAAIITPTPDAFNMAIVAIPIVAIYQLGVIAIFVRHRATSRRDRKAVAKQAQISSALEKDEEPLTTIIEEFEHVANEDDGNKQSSQVFAEQSTPPVVNVPRTIDGFVPRTRQVATSLQVPPRSHAAARLATARYNVPPSGRSIDGFSIRSVTS